MAKGQDCGADRPSSMKMTAHSDEHRAGKPSSAPPKMYITQEELQRERIPVKWRDFCSHLLPQLNACRRANYYAPWACELERTAWKKCQYDEYCRRMVRLSERKEADLARKLLQDE